MQGGHFEIDAQVAGTRLDAFLAERLGLSRVETRRLLARGVVAVDGIQQDASAKGRRLLLGARVDVADWTRPEDQRVLPATDPALAILAQGPGWLAVDKPAGMPVHPQREDESGTVANFVASRHPELHGVGEGGLRSGVVHRLDVDTSGVLLMATDAATWTRLRRAFRRHRVAKTYRAVALGTALADEGRVELGLRVAQHRPARVAVVDPERARTDRSVRVARLGWRVLERLAGGCLVEVDLETGFLHQVRATLAHLGAPLAGDPTYGTGAADPSGASRQMLHAARVTFEEIEAHSPDPPDLLATLDRLRR